MFRTNGMPRAQGCAGAAPIKLAVRFKECQSTRTTYPVCRGRRDAQERRLSSWQSDSTSTNLSAPHTRYAAGAGKRTTAGMQEVEQRRSSCRGAAPIKLAERFNEYQSKRTTYPVCRGRTTAGMQEVEQCRSNCRGAHDLQGCRR
jgi:hypothetical protein